MFELRLNTLFALLLLTLGLVAVGCGDSRDSRGDDDDASDDDDAADDDDATDDDDVVNDDDDDDDDATDDDDAAQDATPCADDDWGGFSCNPLTQAECDLNAGEACDSAYENGALTNFQCYPAPNEAQVGEACDGGAGPWCAGGATCVADDSGAQVCATWCCSDSQCEAGMTCRITGAFAPAASDLGVCL